MPTDPAPSLHLDAFRVGERREPRGGPAGSSCEEEGEAIPASEEVRERQQVKRLRFGGRSVVAGLLLFATRTRLLSSASFFPESRGNLARALLLQTSLVRLPACGRTRHRIHVDRDIFFTVGPRACSRPVIARSVRRYVTLRYGDGAARLACRRDQFPWRDVTRRAASR